MSWPVQPPPRDAERDVNGRGGQAEQRPGGGAARRRVDEETGADHEHRVNRHHRQLRPAEIAPEADAGQAEAVVHDREGKDPAEGLGVDQECMTEPVEASQEIAEAEPPARSGGGEHAAETPNRAIDEPNQDREGDEGNGPDIRRRQRQRRRRTGQECDQDTPPPLS